MACAALELTKRLTSSGVHITKRPVEIARVLIGVAHASRVLAIASRHRELSVPVTRAGKPVLTRLQNRHARRMRSPEKCAPLLRVSLASRMHRVRPAARLVTFAKSLHSVSETAVFHCRSCCGGSRTHACGFCH